MCTSNKTGVSAPQLQITHSGRLRGFTLIELLISLVIGSILLLALNGLVGQGLQAYDTVNGKAGARGQSQSTAPAAAE